MSTDSPQKSAPKKIILYRFLIELNRIHIRTFLGSAVLATFKIGPHEVRMKDWIQIEMGVAEAKSPQHLQLECEMIYNQELRQFEPLKAILKIHLKLHQSKDSDKGEGLAGVVYLNLADELNNFRQSVYKELPISNCSDFNAKIDFKLEIVDISDANLVDKSYSDAQSQSYGLLPDSIDMSSRIDQSVQDPLDPDVYLGKVEQINGLKTKLQQLRIKYNQQVKRNNQYANDEINLIDELKKQKEQVMNYKRQLDQQQKEKKANTGERKGAENAERQKQIYRMRNEYEQLISAYQGLAEQNLHLKKNMRQYQKQRKQYQQKLAKSKEATQKADNSQATLRLQELDELVKQYYNQNQLLKGKNKKLTDELNNKPSGSLQQQKSSLCLNCKNLENQYRTKETLYEEQLGTLEKILNDAKAETKRMTKKYQHKAMKARHYEAKAKEVGDYQQMFTYVLKSLVALIETVGKNVIENIPEEKELQPYCFQSVFDEIFTEIRHYVLSKPEDEVKYKEMNLNIIKLSQSSQLDLLKKKDNELAKLNKQLLKVYSHLEEAQEECDQIRQSYQKIYERRNSMESATPRFNQISFSKLPGTEHYEQMQQDYNQLVSNLQKLTEQKRILEQQLRLFKTAPSIIEKRLSKIQEGQSPDSSIIRLDEQFTLEHQKDLEALRKIISLKQTLCADLDRNFKQLSEDYKEIKSQCEGYKVAVHKMHAQMEILRQYAPTKASKILKIPNGLATIEEEREASIEDEIKDLIQSIDVDNKQQTQREGEELQTPRQGLSQESEIGNIKLIEMKQQVQRRLKGVNLEFLRMQSLRVSKCRSSQETQQTIIEFNNIRNRMDEVSEYLELIGK